MSAPPLNFALVGAAGYIAPRHLQAVRDTGNHLVAAADPHDAVGILDSYFPEARYFREIERFDRHLDKLHRAKAEERIHWVSICSPNFLHDAHVRLALRSGADALCEKPLVINPWNLDALETLERETGRRVRTVLQLRVHPSLAALHRSMSAAPPAAPRDVVLTYVTARGPWYRYSWKGDPGKSGGVAVNIGIHFFDLLTWLFGPPERVELHRHEPGRMAGFIELKHARVRWFLSIDAADLPFPLEPGKKSTYRSITIDGEEIEFTEGFKDLHTRVYEETLAGRGFGINDARPSIELVHRLVTSPLVTPTPDTAHPFLGCRL
ncbi:MAG: Gfo/Idh/MocA family oxidoreductase [Acidobacteria bacterium]|nr:Gfo/Idh/MocA family oxidoreductase [Acidobacteriota bacterium]